MKLQITQGAAANIVFRMGLSHVLYQCTTNRV